MDTECVTLSAERVADRFSYRSWEYGDEPDWYTSDPHFPDWKVAVSQNNCSEDQEELLIKTIEGRDMESRSWHDSVPKSKDDKVGDRDFNQILEQLKLLRNLPIPEDGYIVNPLPEVIGMAISVLQEALVGSQFDLPKAQVVADGEGGVRLRWRKQGCDLKFVVPTAHSHDMYIYHEKSGDYSVVKPVDAEKLARWFGWFTS